MAGWSPFQFSSGQRQYEVSSGTLTSNIPFVGDVVKDAISWYEMWINPSNVAKSFNFITAKQQTADAIVTFHYRPDFGTLSCQGKVGWVRIKSDIEVVTEGALNNVLASVSNATIGTDIAIKSYADLKREQIRSPHASQINNSPLAFLNRLKSLALAPMYYTDKFGVDHYNPKYIKVFTREYPKGVIYEGYFNQFDVMEDTDMGETVGYSFQFIIEDEKPVTILQRVLGAYADKGSVIGDAASAASGFL